MKPPRPITPPPRIAIDAPNLRSCLESGPIHRMNFDTGKCVDCEGAVIRFVRSNPEHTITPFTIKLDK